MKSLSLFPFRSLRLAHYVFVVVLLLRLLSLLQLSDSVLLLPSSGDMHFYNEWARQILQGHATDGHAFYGLPLYAYFLAGLYWLFGYNPFIPGAIQAGFESGTAVIIYSLAVRIFDVGDAGGSFALRYRGQCIGIFAALGWAFFLPAQAYSIILMPTAGSVFVFWFLIWQMVNRSRFTYTRIFSLAILIGFTATGVATVLFLIPLLLVRVFVRSAETNGMRHPWLSRLAAASFIFAGIGLGTAPCWIHNYFVAKDPVFLSAHSGVNFWIGNNPVANGYPRFPPGLHAGQRAMLQDSITTVEQAAGHPLKRSEVSMYWSAKARSYIKDNSIDWLKLILIKIKNFWNAFQYDDLGIITILRDQRIIFPGIGFGLVAAFGLPGLLVGWRKFPAARWVGAAVLLHMTSLLAVFVTERYRLAAVPGLLVFAAFWIWELWWNVANRRMTATALSFVLLFGATGFVSFPQKDPALWALDTYNSGLQALEAGNTSLARQKLDLAYAYSPFNAEINFAEGNLHFTTGALETAKSFYWSTLHLDSAHLGAFNNLGLLALAQNDSNLAAELFRHALARAPDDPKLHYLLARAEMNQGNFAAAQREIACALETDPGRSEYVQLKNEIEQACP